ncbi:MAG: metallophosphoesterase [Opitutaceae bacterium]
MPASDIPESLEALAQRMGETRFRERLAKERQLVERLGHGQGRGIFQLENYINFYALVKAGLKLTGLWARAHRNYFDIQVEHNEVVLTNLPPAFDGYRILQLTDLHADLHPGFVDAVKRTIAPLDYDQVVITGDFRTCTFGDHTGATEASIEILKDLAAPCYAILGNHDFLIKVPTLEAAGIRFLLNESVELRSGEAVVHLVGIDDPNFYETHDFEHALRGVPAGDCKLLLSHAPQTFREAAQYGFSLQLSGHTHGGQICLPGGHVLVHDHTSPRHVLSGAWQEGNLQGYTSRGTGGSALPVRLNCPAEVTVHTLRCAKSE